MKIYQNKSIFQFSLILLLVVAMLIVFGTEAGRAQTPEPTATPDPLSVSPSADESPASTAAATAVPLDQTPGGVTEVTFAQLNESTIDLQSPLDQYAFFLVVPYRWVIDPENSYIELHYDFRMDSDDAASRSDSESTEARVEVYVDDILAATFVPKPGSNQVQRLPIPPDAVDDPERNRYQLRFVYFNGDCDNPHDHSALSIRTDSFIHFEYDQTPLALNLADFPQPVVQGLFSPETVLIVVPDQYSEADLAAAASVAAALGRRTYNNAQVDLMTASQATPELLATSSAILVGKADKNEFIAGLYRKNLLPTRLGNTDTLITGPADQPIAADDGILQEIRSEYSDDHVYLVVTGGSDVAVSRAAQALSVLEPRYGLDGNLIVIEDLRETFSDPPPAEDTLSLADLGFRDTVLYGISSQTTTANFFIPANWRLVEQPSLTLSYFNSSNLRQGTSGLIVKLNDKVVGSAPIDDSVLGERQAEIQLPVADLKFGGQNRLSFETILDLDLTECVLPQLDLAWIRISEASQLKLPHVETIDNLPAVASLKDSLAPFAAREDLIDVWFSLPAEPAPAELAGLVETASWLGSLSGGAGFVPRVSMGTVDNMDQLESYHVIALGRPTENPVIEAMNEFLPQPFEPGQDTLQQEVGNVVYRLPEQFSLGVLQALPNPWNAEKVVLVATGTTPQSVEWALDTLTDRQTYYELGGDLTFIRDDRLETFESAQYIRGSLLAAVEAVTAVEPAEATAEPAGVVPSETEPAGAEEAEPFVIETVPTPVVPAPSAAGTLPEAYLPPDSSPPPIVNQLIMGLIGTGLILAAFGSVVSWRKSRKAG